MKKTLFAVLVITLLGILTAPAQAVPQFARPDSDVTVGPFTPTPLWQQLDDNDNADTVSAASSTASQTFEVGTSNVTDPLASTGHVLRASLKKVGSNAQNVTVTLVQGTTTVAAMQVNGVTTSFVTYSYSLTATEADSITDYTDLRIRVNKNAGAKNQLVVGWVELEVPDAGPPDPCNAHIAGDQPTGFTVPAGQLYCIDGTVTSPANVQVFGTLQMRAGDHLIFTNVNEAAFVGGGMFSSTNPPPATDVGLWVLDAGVLDVQGTPKVGWNRTGTDPSWLPGDEVRVTPTALGDYTTFNTFTPGSPVPQADPSVPAAEVFNLTRDVSIEGTTAGHSHIFIESTSPQTIKYATLRYLGVPVAGTLDGGRYALHFHHSMAGSVGSVVEGVVVQDFGRRGLVAHHSDGILFQDDIAFDGKQEATWWDQDLGNESNNVTFNHILAAKVDLTPLGNSRSAVFTLGMGTGNALTDSVAVGFIGTAKNYNGFNWPEQQGATWVFTNDVAHNNPKSGAQIWQNSSHVHDSPGYVAYRNGLAGIIHGAYSTDFTWTANLYQNLQSLQLHAGGGKFIGPSTWTVTGANQIVTDVHSLPFPGPTPFNDINFVGQAGALLKFNDAQGNNPAIIDFCRSTSNGGPITSGMFDFTLAHVGTVVRVQQVNGTAYRLEKLSDGTVQNTTIASFC